MGPKIIVILVLVVLVGGIVFVARSGVFSKLGSLNLKSVFPLGGATTANSTSTSPKPQNSTTTKPNISTSTVATKTTSTVSSVVGHATIKPSDIPAGFTAEDMSPYFHQVRFNSVSTSKVSLAAKFSGPGAIDVTDWLIKANRGSQVVGTAINIYYPVGDNPEGDVYLSSSNVLNMYIGTNSVGPNLRLNKCIGYLKGSFQYNPSLPGGCPAPYSSKSDLSSFTGQCQNYITSLGSCQVPKSNVLLPQNDYACLAFIQNISYRSCFNTHAGDSNFLSNEWRMWVSGKFLDSKHDVVKLLDRNGKLVDLYSY